MTNKIAPTSFEVSVMNVLGLLAQQRGNNPIAQSLMNSKDMLVIAKHLAFLDIHSPVHPQPYFADNEALEEAARAAYLALDAERTKVANMRAELELERQQFEQYKRSVEGKLGALATDISNRITNALG